MKIEKKIHTLNWPKNRKRSFFSKNSTRHKSSVIIGKEKMRVELGLKTGDTDEI